MKEIEKFMSIQDLMKTTGDDLYLPDGNIIDFGDNFQIRKNESLLGYLKQKEGFVFIVKEYNTNNIQAIKFFQNKQGFKEWFKYKLIEGIKIIEDEVEKKNPNAYLSDEVMEIYCANNI